MMARGLQEEVCRSRRMPDRSEDVNEQSLEQARANWEEALTDWDGYLTDPPVESFEEEVRVAADSGVLSVVAPFAALLLLRWLEHVDTEQETNPWLGDAAARPHLFTSDMNWSAWSHLRGRELTDFLHSELAPALASAPKTAWGLKLSPLSLLLELGFESIYPPALDRMIDFASCFDMGSSAGRKVAQDNLATVVERETRGTSQFSTPTTMAELMVEVLDPMPGASIYDPCFGTGALLAKAVRKVRTRVASANAEAPGPEHASPRVFGVENNPFAYVIGAAQAVLASASSPSLELRNALQVSPAGTGCRRRLRLRDGPPALGPHQPRRR